jgi:hypothetical protein
VKGLDHIPYNCIPDYSIYVPLPLLVHRQVIYQQVMVQPPSGQYTSRRFNVFPERTVPKVTVRPPGGRCARRSVDKGRGSHPKGAQKVYWQLLPLGKGEKKSQAQQLSRAHTRCRRAVELQKVVLADGLGLTCRFTYRGREDSQKKSEKTTGGENF